MRARGRRRIAPHLRYRSTPPVPGLSSAFSERNTHRTRFGGEAPGRTNDACPPFTATAAPPSPLNEYSAPRSFQTPNQVMGENGLAQRFGFGFGLVLHVLFLWVRLQIVYAQGKTTKDHWHDIERSDLLLRIYDRKAIAMHWELFKSLRIW